MKKLLILMLLFCTLFVSISYAELAGDPTDPAWWAQELTPSPTKPPVNEFENENWQTNWGAACDPKKDIMLNISIPFIWRCIKKDANANQVTDTDWNSTVGNVFPKLMWGMIRLVMTIIYIVWFLGILIGWFMIAASGADPSLKEKWKSLIIMVIWWLILLWASGVILNLINPDFFWTNS